MDKNNPLSITAIKIPSLAPTNKNKLTFTERTSNLNNFLFKDKNPNNRMIKFDNISNNKKVIDKIKEEGSSQQKIFRFNNTIRLPRINQISNRVNNNQKVESDYKRFHNYKLKEKNSDFFIVQQEKPIFYVFKILKYFILKYKIRNKANKDLIFKVMDHRLNWAYTTDKNIKNVSFSWHYFSHKIKYNLINQEAQKNLNYQFVNLFEFHNEITNKKRFLINMLKYCNVNKSKFIF